MPQAHSHGTTKQTGPRKVDGSPDLRYKTNEQPGSAAYDSRHRNPHAGGPPPQRRRHDRPTADDGDAANADGTLDMRFLENRIKAGLVEDPEGERSAAAREEPNVPSHRRVGKAKGTHRRS